VERVKHDLRVRDAVLGADRLLPADMSIETALIDAFCSSVSPAKNAVRLSALRPSVAHTIDPA
jgi:hypothetical protein